MNKLLSVGLLLLMGCGEWEGGQVGRASCVFDDFLPNVGKAFKMASGNNGQQLYILDDFSYVYSYKRDNLYECAFNLENTYRFNGFPKDVLFANNNFYVQDVALLKNKEDKELCYARDGVFAVSGNELAVGGKFGMEIWNIPSCTRKSSISSSQEVLALTAYYVAEQQNLAMYSKNWEIIRREPVSFCSADRIAANDYGVYLFDKKCKKIEVFDNYAVWRKTISLDSLGIKNPLDIGAGEYSYIFIMHSNGVEKVNVF